MKEDPQTNTYLFKPFFLATILSTMNYLSTPIAAYASNYDQSLQDLAYPIFALSHMATFINIGVNAYKLKREGRTNFTKNFERTIFAITPLFATFISLRNIEPPIDAPPTSPIIPEWMIPDLKQAMRISPRLAEVAFGLQSIASKVIASM